VINAIYLCRLRTVFELYTSNFGRKKLKRNYMWGTRAKEVEDHCPRRNIRAQSATMTSSWSYDPCNASGVEVAARTPVREMLVRISAGTAAIMIEYLRGIYHLPAKYRGQYLEKATTISFRILSNSPFARHPTSGRRTVWTANSAHTN
jgi:hypothetical protein